MRTRRGAADEMILSALDRVELAGLGVQLVPVVDEKTLRCTQELLPIEFKAPLNSATAAWAACGPLRSRPAARASFVRCRPSTDPKE